MLKEIKTGAVLPELRKKILQENINLYAEATGMVDPIHTNPEIAATTVFKTTIVHGATLLDYISRVMFDSFGLPWYLNGTMSAKIIAPVKKDEVVLVQGNIESVAVVGGTKTVVCSLTCSDSNGVAVVAEATVTLTE